VDRLLEGLRWHCQPDPYRLVPGPPDRWAGKCPLHPDAGFTLLITETNGDADVWCSVGCPEGWIRYVIDRDLDRDREAAERAQMLVWAQTWRAAA
jgi:hypothetical protein